jgi:pectate lyase
MHRFIIPILRAAALVPFILSAAPAVEPRPSFELLGFASVSAHGLSTTTGGENARGISVRTARELQTALERTDIKKKAGRGKTPRVVRIDADIDLGELANEQPGEVIKSVGRVHVLSNTTVYAAGAGATLRRGILEVHGAHNVIIRNLKFRDLWEDDPTGKFDRFGWDYIRVANSGKTRSHHVWIDHCDFEKCYDGMIDITHGSDLVTVSWCRFAGDARGPQKKVSLIGHSSSATAAALDRGRLNVTLHHNLFENIADRAPRARFANIHALNNLVDGAENATISVMSAATLVEGCFYKDCRIATTFSHAADSVSKGQGGALLIVESRNVEPRPAPTPGDEREAFEIEHNFKGSTEPGRYQFNAPADWKWPDLRKMPYVYRADPVDEVPGIVRRHAGAGKLTDTDLPKFAP